MNGPDDDENVKDFLTERLKRGRKKAGKTKPRSAPSEGGDREADADLAEMNKEFAVVKIGGRTRVMALEESAIYTGWRIPVYSTFTDFRNFHHRRKLDRGTGREIGIGAWWLAQEGRRQYAGVIYAPGKETPGYFNLWQGFACEPRAGNFDLFRAHLRENICAHNEGHAEYLLNWMARAVQEPGTPGEVAVILRGTEGVGKGVFAVQFGQLFGPHFLQVSQASHLTGNFNNHLHGCSVLFADEALFAGDRSHDSVLKTHITEPTLQIEPKGVDSFVVPNCLHILMSSNESWVVPAGADARRYFVLDVGTEHKRDFAYFRAIIDQMKDGGREALLHYLLQRDLTGFDVRAVPETTALAEQKAYSRRGVDQLVEVIADQGILPCAYKNSFDVALTTGEDRGKGFYAAARRLAPDLKHRSARVIANELIRHWGCRAWKSDSKRGLMFPRLAELRRLFDAKHGKQSWAEIDGWGCPSDPDQEVFGDD
jgi:hypothetical protein